VHNKGGDEQKQYRSSDREVAFRSEWHRQKVIYETCEKGQG